MMTPTDWKQVRKGTRVLLDNLGEAYPDTMTATVVEKKSTSRLVTVVIDEHYQVPVRRQVLKYDYVLELIPQDPLDAIYPMLAKEASMTPTMIEQSELYWLQQKIDGERSIPTYQPAVGELPRVFRATTRVVSKVTGALGENQERLPHMADLPLPENGPTVFDGELTHPQGFSTLRSIMAADPTKAIATQLALGNVEFMAFDVLWFNGIDLRQRRYEERLAILESYLEDLGPHFRPWWFKVVTTARTTEAKKIMLENYPSYGWEGLMVRFKDAPYADSTRPNVRSPHLLKIKPFQTCERVIVGVEWGKGEFNGAKVAALRLAKWVKGASDDGIGRQVVNGQVYSLVNAGTAGGLTDEFAEEMLTFFTDNTSPWAECPVAEIKYQEVLSNGGLRHPNFVRIRTDVDVTDVVRVA